MKLIIFILTSLFLLLYSIPNKARAATLNNQNYNIDIQNIDTAPQKDKLVPIETKPAAQYAPRTEVKEFSLPLLFSVSENQVDFGVLATGNASKRSVMLSSEAGSEYQIKAFEDHPLRGTANQILADTTCDNGSCSEIRNALWINELTFGFGYSCKPISNCIDLTDDESYKQFADLSSKEKPQKIILGKKQKTEIILKANIPSSQKPASLSNTVTFMAIPSF